MYFNCLYLVGYSLAFCLCFGRFQAKESTCTVNCKLQNQYFLNHLIIITLSHHLTSFNQIKSTGKQIVSHR